MADTGCFVRYRVFNTDNVIYFSKLSDYYSWKAEMEAVQVESFKILEVIKN